MKYFKALGESKGFQIDSPRSAIGAALQMGLLSDESNWINMLKDRNNTAHIYNAEVAKQIHGRVVTEYLPEFLRVQANSP